MKEEDEPQVSDVAEAEEPKEEKAAPVPFVAEPAKRPTGPTAEQKGWLSKNKGYARMSHHRSVRFVSRGTLKVDGSFIPETVHPVMDGNGDFGVGMPVAETKRRR